MLTFPISLDRGEDPLSGMPVLGFQHNERFIFNPYLDPSLTHEVDPVQAYGITHQDADKLVRLNALLLRATRAALEAGCLVIQHELGLQPGSAAEVHLTQERTTRPVVQTLVEYVLREVGDRAAAKDDPA